MSLFSQEEHHEGECFVGEESESEFEVLAFPYFHFEQRIGYHEGVDKPRKIGKSVGERRTDNQYPECIGVDVGASQEVVGLAARSALYAHIPHEPPR